MSLNFLAQPKKRLHHYFIPCPANGHRPHFVRHGALGFYSGLIIAGKILTLALLFIAYPSPAQFSTVTANRIIELTNRERAAAGLPVLMHSAILDASALLKSQDMLAANYFAHDSPTGVTPWEWFKQAGYNYTYAGENLAMNFSEAEEAMAAWMNSPTHKANILNPNYDEIGLAVAIGKIDGRETTLVVEHFGKSYVNPAAEQFAKGSAANVGSVAGITEVSGGESITVTFEKTPHSFGTSVVHYVQKGFLVLLIFIIINLLLTIIVRIRVQHKPIIVHCLIVIGLGLMAVFYHLHFLESVAGHALQII